MALPRRSVDRFLNQREHLPGATVEEVSPCRVVAGAASWRTCGLSWGTGGDERRLLLGEPHVLGGVVADHHLLGAGIPGNSRATCLLNGG